MKVKVKVGNEYKEINVNQEESILKALQRNEIMIQAPCNGRGTCGNCKIYVDGKPEAQLACQTYPVEGMQIELVQAVDRMQVLTEFVTNKQEPKQIELEKMQPKEYKSEPNYYVAIDLGTTTIVVVLLKTSEQGLITVQTIRGINPQISFGADVISRITASNQGNTEALKHCIQQYLEESIAALCSSNEIERSRILRIVIAGNTTMMHLLRGRDVSGLGTYPFEPVTLAREEYYEEDTLIMTFPGISAFVGGDITAGIYALNLHEAIRPSILVDLGTNGEIVIGNRERILVTSTAAGPAMEGGNLSCGIGSVPGAIREVTIKKRYTTYQTIENRPAIGICGSGAIELLAELYTKDEIDEHGTFRKQEYLREGFPVDAMGNIRFTQQDIRQIQLAKGAIRAGIETLMNAYQVTYDEIEHLYLAGGMGFALNLEKACQIGLFPSELRRKVECVGNSCLGGVIKFLNQLEQGKIEEVNVLDQLIIKSTSLPLATLDGFTQNYLNFIEF